MRKRGGRIRRIPDGMRGEVRMKGKGDMPPHGIKVIRKTIGRATEGSRAHRITTPRQVRGKKGRRVRVMIGCATIVNMEINVYLPTTPDRKIKPRGAGPGGGIGKLRINTHREAPRGLPKKLP